MARLTELHSSRIEAIVAKAIREHSSEHECECEDCDEANAELASCAAGEGAPRVYDVDLLKVTQSIIIGLKKLEAELVAA